jgi:hypothetical protein
MPNNPIHTKTKIELEMEQTRSKLENDPDFIAIKRFGFSLDAISERYPEGCPKHIIGKALLLSDDEIDALYDKIVLSLREKMKV